MKKGSMMLAVFCVVMTAFIANAQQAADERATKEECVAKVHEVAKLIQEAGLEPAIEKMNDVQGPFTWKDSYVYCFEDVTGKILGHKNPSLIGYEAKDWRDVNGKPIFREMFHVVNTKGEGFVTHMYPRVPGGAPETKIAYVYKIPGTNLIVGAGYFE